MRKLLGRIHRSKSTKATFLRFAGVGATISVIDVVVLYLLLSLELNEYLSRTISLSMSMAAGYTLNRYFTFHHLETGRALWHSLLRHYSGHSIGGMINMAVFAVVLIVGQAMGGEVEASAALPLLGVWIGGMAGMTFNFFFSKNLVFDN